MPLVHKTVDVRREVWRTLRLNAETADVRLRDYLTYLIVHAKPPTPEERALIQQVARENEAERTREPK